MTVVKNCRSESERQKLKNEMLAHLPKLKGVALSLTRDSIRAEDLVQQTIFQGIDRLDQFKSGTNMGAWLTTILKNYFTTSLRHRKREVEWNYELEDSLFFSTGANSGYAESAYDFNRLLLYLACLSEEQSDALIAVGYLGLSYEEASERLNCAIGTVKSRVSRARLNLDILIAETQIKHVSLAKLKNAASGVPINHPYYPIAKAYEELYADCEGIAEDNSADCCADESESAVEQHWENIVKSGALDEEYESMDQLMQSVEDY